MNMDVIAQLAVAARGSMLKEARLPVAEAVKRFTSRLRPQGRGPAMPSPAHMPTPPVPPSGGGFPWGRAAATTAGVGGAGVYGYGLYNQAQHEPGVTANPFTWGGWGNNQTQHDRSFNKWKNLNERGQNELDQAITSGDERSWFSKSPEQLQKELDSGSYGQSGGWSFGGLNPFYRPGMGAYEKDVSRINAGDQARQQRIQERMSARVLRGAPGDYTADIASATGEQRNQLLQRQQQTQQFSDQLDTLKKRMEQAQAIPGIKSRMQQPSPTGRTPAGPWPMGNRPGHPGGFQGWALNPHDYRRDPRSHDVWEEVLARSGQQGGLARPH